jgi:hypothetical protein
LVPATKGCGPPAPDGGHNSQAGAVAVGAAAGAAAVDLPAPAAAVVAEDVERPALIVRAPAVPELLAAAAAADPVVPGPAVPPVVAPPPREEVVAVVVGVVKFVEEPTPPDPVGEAVETAAVVPAVAVPVVVCATAGADRKASSAAAMHAIASPIPQRIKAFIATRSVPRPALNL